MIKRDLPVIAGLSGGLGNQMFQYAIGRSLSQRIGAALWLDLSWFQGRGDRHFALAPFDIRGQQCLAWPRLPPLAQAQLSRISRRWFPRIMGVPVWREPHFNFTPKFNEITGPVFLEGYWQSEQYFKGIRELLLREFALRQPLPSRCLEMLNRIRDCDAICVHVRRGDYVSNPVAQRVHGTLPLSYYQQGVLELKKDLTRPRCFIFSDDPEWVRSTMKVDCPATIVDINDGAAAHLDLILMSACDHFLLANSSLSWWGAWLNDSVEKRVIAPAQWFPVPNIDTRDLIPNTWIRQ